MMLKKLSVTSASILALAISPSYAQNAPILEVEAQQGPEVLTVDVNEQRTVAIPALVTPNNVNTDAGTTEALGQQIAAVIASNLNNSGIFRTIGPNGVKQITFNEVTAPQFSHWQGRNADQLIQGFVQSAEGGRITVGCYLYDVTFAKETTRSGFTVDPADWRRAAHKCADIIYSRLTGEAPFFDSRIAYIAETGPKDNRVKRLAIMDSDGANHRYITNGRSTALTPRFSPNYKSLLYLSYVDGNPRIYVYDLDTGQQRLIVETGNPTFAPRWSPDGKFILYSMAIGGNTDIYKIAVNGGRPERLTSSPRIDVGGSFSPDGSQIVFESDRSGSQQIYIMNSDGSNQRRISFGSGRFATPEWSPRGDLIAFTKIGGGFRVGTMRTDGSNQRLLTNSWQDEAPTWAPNGRVIQFFRTARGSGETSIWQVDLTGNFERKLPTPVNASDPSWGPIRP